MKKEIFNNIIKKLEIPRNKWINFNEIDSIIMNDGKGYYPNWKYCKFLIREKDILIKYGKSKPYGARFPLICNFHQGKDYIEFPGRLRIPDTEYYENFRNPKIGDIIRATDGKIVEGEAIIENISYFFDKTLIKFSNPIYAFKQKFSFYDPSEYNENCAHSNPIEGIYMKFIENKGKKNKTVNHHSVIRIKDIKEINLKLNTISNKVFPLGGEDDD